MVLIGMCAAIRSIVGTRQYVSCYKRLGHGPWKAMGQRLPQSISLPVECFDVVATTTKSTAFCQGYSYLPCLDLSNPIPTTVGDSSRRNCLLNKRLLTGAR